MYAYLYHHGVKGQKWGVRRYQYADGTLTPAGKKRKSVAKSRNGIERFSSLMSIKASDLVKQTKTLVTGKQYADGYLKKGTSLARIQTSKEFEKFAFYATYKKADTNKYMGLFGKNLVSRAAAEARRAETQANVSGLDEDISRAKEARDRANTIKVYQLKLEAQRKLKIPSDENASDITVKLLKERDFKDNVIASIQDSKEIMRRPSQQILFRQAQNALNKDLSNMSSSDKISIYKALNLSLTNHNQQEIAAQSRFYGELKKKGYNALLDYNDKEYSSYHAKRPVIVFDVDSVKLQSVSETNPKVVDKFYRKYNTERFAKEIASNAVKVPSMYASMTVSECTSYVNRRVNEYLGQ